MATEPHHHVKVVSHGVVVVLGHDLTKMLCVLSTRPLRTYWHGSTSDWTEPEKGRQIPAKTNCGTTPGSQTPGVTATPSTRRPTTVGH